MNRPGVRTCAQPARRGADLARHRGQVEEGDHGGSSRLRSGSSELEAAARALTWLQRLADGAPRCPGRPVGEARDATSSSRTGRPSRRDSSAASSASTTASPFSPSVSGRAPVGDAVDEMPVLHGERLVRGDERDHDVAVAVGHRRLGQVVTVSAAGTRPCRGRGSARPRRGRRRRPSSGCPTAVTRRTLHGSSQLTWMFADRPRSSKKSS